MVNLNDIETTEQLHKLQLENKITKEELKEAVRILHIKKLKNLIENDISYKYNSNLDLVQKNLDFGQKRRRNMVRKIIASLDFDEKTEDEKKYDEEFAKFQNKH